MFASRCVYLSVSVSVNKRAYLSRSVTFQVIDFPLTHASRVDPLVLSLSSHITLTGFLTAVICARLMSVHIMSFK